MPKDVREVFLHLEPFLSVPQGFLVFFLNLHFFDHMNLSPKNTIKNGGSTARHSKAISEWDTAR